MGDGYHIPTLQKLRSSRSEEKLTSSNHGSKAYKLNDKNLTDYEYNSFDEIDSKDDDNDVLFARKKLLHKNRDINGICP